MCDEIVFRHAVVVGVSLLWGFAPSFGVVWWGDVGGVCFLCCLLDGVVDFGEEAVDVFAVVEVEVAAFGAAVFWGGCCVVAGEEDLGLGGSFFGVVCDVDEALF